MEMTDFERITLMLLKGMSSSLECCITIKKTGVHYQILSPATCETYTLYHCFDLDTQEFKCTYVERIEDGDE
jgi:hypothetical protein